MQASEEINNFCKYFTKSLITNGFVQSTIIPIAGYIIRRFYCPTEYFKDRSFFIFNHSNRFEKPNIYEKISYIFFTEQPDISQVTQFLFEIMQYDKNSTCIVKKEFSKNDFIHLRRIDANSKATFMLAIHRESFYLLVIKYVFVSMENLKNVDHEINFCESYKNRCLVPFYGFVKNDGKIIGFVYEFMANGSLDSYLSKNIQYKDIFIMMTINRLCQGIFYLHSNFLVHRDLKPSNILVNNDLLPFISDFETIRKPIDEVDFPSGETMSNDLGTPLYSSPEQDFGEYVSYPSDIYSFGLIIYYMYEMRDMWSHEILSKSSKKFLRAKPMTNGPINIKKIYEDCVKLSIKERPTITEIIGKLIDDFYNAQDKPIQSYNDKIKLLKDNIFIENIIICKIYYEYINKNTKKSDSDQVFNKLDPFFAFVQLFERGLIFEEKGSSQKMDLYEISAQNNNPDSLFNLGIKYYFGLNIEKNIEKSIEYFEAAAKLNHHHALNSMGYFYLEGIGVKKDYLKAKEYFEKSANQYNSTALYNLGAIFESGKGVKQDYGMAFKYYSLSAKLNNPRAQNSLGIYYDKGCGIKSDYSKAIAYYKLSAEQNYSYAWINLADLYKNGVVFAIDTLKARYYYELAAQQFNHFAYLSLGNLYAKYYVKDYLKARYYYEKACEYGNTEAYFHLGYLYKKGLGVEQNYKKAKDYYEISASYNNPNAYFELGELYKNGFGVKINYLYAKNYYEKSSELGNPAAYFNLAEFYSNGDINDVNYEKSIQYYMKCIEIPRNYFKIYDKKPKSYSFSYMHFTYINHSYNNIGLIYMTVFDNIEKAGNFFKSAAFSEYPFAENNYGLFLQFYMNKLDNAKIWYERSSKHNFAIAEYNLGHFYEEKGDVKKSIEYYCKASEDEAKPLIYHNKQHFDKRLEISKIFVVCFTNLKLVNIFFSLSNFEKAKKYFIKSIDILTKNDSNYRFYLKLNKTKKDNIFSYLKEFILNFPLFNLTIFKDTKNTREDLKRELLNSETVKIKIPEIDFELTSGTLGGKFTTVEGLLVEIQKNLRDILDIDRNQFNDKYLLIKKQKNVQKDNEFSNINEQNYFIEIDNDIVFESASDLFDYIIQNNDLKKVFINEIIDIINAMNLILYTKPFSILFGRIDIMKNKK
ncbi:Interleukin-1 receptor-associated kinase 4 [Tritrichomonas musculus]|uniref:Interleukin-1 receptor-associated kinase 4 n=1 Tax=Tritrichomonas musculus TaxID=1915356 RepID=A0ABR2GSR7_9EUKA